MKDEQIIECIRAGNNNRALRKLYAYLPVVRNMILKNGGTRADALDVYQDALMVFYSKVSEPGFHLTSSISTYVFSICRNKWMEELRRRGKTQTVNWEIKSEVDTSEWQLHEEKLKLLQQVLIEVGEKCKRIFTLFYFEKLEMKTIAAKLGYTSEQNAATQKFKCMERARTIARERNLMGEVL